MHEFTFTEYTLNKYTSQKYTSHNTFHTYTLVQHIQHSPVTSRQFLDQDVSVVMSASSQQCGLDCGLWILWDTEAEGYIGTQPANMWPSCQHVALLSTCGSDRAIVMQIPRSHKQHLHIVWLQHTDYNSVLVAITCCLCNLTLLICTALYIKFNVISSSNILKNN